MEKKELISGNEAVVRGAIDGGAEVFFGYPITPATEILEGWINEAVNDASLKYLQAEDETASGFAVIGAILAGKKAFTATAGIGHVLMQDPIAMAENERLPFVCIIPQRGGPSTGTVIYSQQEVNLAALGGNGDGLRIVYSASSVSEIYELSSKIFSVAWKYRFPTFLLSDGYLGKQKVNTELAPPIKPYPASPILKESTSHPVHIRNCYGSEKEFAKVLSKNISDYKLMIPKISECENYKTAGATLLVIAHGSVAASSKEAIDRLRDENLNVGLIRPITLRPLDCRSIRLAVKKAKKVFVIESSFEQFARILIYKVPEISQKVKVMFKPAEGISPDEIYSFIKSQIK